MDAMQEEAYLYLMVTCSECEEDLMPSDLGIANAKDPMEEWSMQFKNAAVQNGWTVTDKSNILCPSCKK